ncbi:MAG: flagellar basal body rod protein [Hydrogenophaga sp.]|uniref:flagellar basal body protein n=1 Tax=Hydrogenophaga sp. TaxID=1904254 RepID=UPI001DB0A91E|nr:flagellar basal body protein [Hydrogenophaga sp.]MBX3608861.1 flagellar basal body rod protein [Hydrogenophaga sp.]
MISALSTATSGLQAASLRLDASAHNVANAMTPGFRREEVRASARAEGGVEAHTERAASPGVSLEQEVVDQMAAALSFKANVKVIETVDRTLGRLFDEKA